MTKKVKEIKKVPVGRRFYLNRNEDLSKISGIGLVAFGVLLPSGKVIIEWIVGEHPSIETHNSIDDCMAIHSHGTATTTLWIDPLDMFVAED